ncbi:hypothetical protein SAMN05216338_108120 [Bradyrhizobium sp. Rc2d]|nr:hypothetical protein SAMN05216338_108120 [Bradyrhizobium sp. Rc2d]
MQGLIRIPGCPVHRRLRTPSKLISQIECLDKRVDHANGVALVNEIIEAFGQQRPLPHDPPLQRSASFSNRQGHKPPIMLDSGKFRFAFGRTSMTHVRPRASPFALEVTAAMGSVGPLQVGPLIASK